MMDIGEEKDLKPRPWIAKGYILRKAVTVVVGAPGIMKSSLMLAWSTAIALGRPHGDFYPETNGKAIVYNVEDDKDEQKRRLFAVMPQFNATREDIRNKIICGHPNGVGTLFTRDQKTGVITKQPPMLKLCQTIEEQQPVALIADPFSELHTAEENDNTAVRAIIAEFRALATKYNLGVVLLHHTRKGNGTAVAGDPDNARGASAITGAARVLLTLSYMTEKEAELYNIPKDRKSRHQYVRLDDGKGNYHGIGDARWYEKKLYRLINGESIPAASPWQPKSAFEGITLEVIKEIFDELRRGPEPGEHYGMTKQGTSQRWAGSVITKYTNKNDEEAKAILTAWENSNLISSKKIRSAKQRKDVNCIEINEEKLADILSDRDPLVDC